MHLPTTTKLHVMPRRSQQATPNFASLAAWPSTKISQHHAHFGKFARRALCSFGVVVGCPTAEETAGEEAASIFKLQRCALEAQDCLDYSWEQLHAGPWGEVSPFWREFYGTAVLMVAACRWRLAVHGRARIPTLRRIAKIIDLGLMMAGPKVQPALATAMHELETELRRHVGAQSAVTSDATAKHDSRSQRKRQFVSLGEPPAHRPLDAPPLPPRLASARVTALQRRVLPPLQDFLENHLITREPVVVQGAMVDWPALRPISPAADAPGSRREACARWADMVYLKRCASHRTVPVEIGEHYLCEEWRQELMPLGEFIDKHVMHPDPGNRADNPRGYLAQHPLFDQIPALRSDIVTPAYCHLSDRRDSGDNDIVTNGWFGPAGTVTPLHYDLKHNLLCQVVGRKYIRLYPADIAGQFSPLYPYLTGMHTNSSQVDVSAPDLDAFPLFRCAPYFECVLAPGEFLYLLRIYKFTGSVLYDV